MFDLDNVRVNVRARVIDEKGELIQPFIFDGESIDGIECYNSGGRSILFTYNGRAIRIKGVDPYGKLTKIVANSPRNKISHVDLYDLLYEINRIISKYTNFPFTEIGIDGRPLGVLSKESAEKEAEALNRLNLFYTRTGLEAPYFLKCMVPTGVSFNTQETCQLWLELPKGVKSDLRIEEYEMLVEEKLSRLTPREIKKREEGILNLYKRIIQWYGFSTRALAESKLLPDWRSFTPQNYGIVPVRVEGYGIFRVDHTSTEIAGNNRSSEDILNGLIEQSCPLFTKILGLSRRSSGIHSSLLGDLSQAFEIGLKVPTYPEPIDETLFKKVLEL